MVLDNSVRIPRAPTYSGTVSHHFTISDTGMSPSSSLLPRSFSYHVMSASLTALYPHLCDGLGSSAFARRYLRNRSLLSSPAGTEMFQFPASRHASLFIHHALTSHYGCRVPPFGHRRVLACLLLAVAFRRLLRPSSPLCA